VMMMGAVIYNLDPLYHFAEIIFSEDFRHRFSVEIFTFRLVTWFVVNSQNSRLFPLMTILIVVYVQRCNNLLDKIRSEKSITKAFEMYRKLELVMKIGDKFQHCLVSSCLFLGLSFTVAFNYAALKMYDVLPGVIYPYFPSVSFTVLLIISFMLPKIVMISVKSLDMVDKLWKLRALDSPVKCRRYHIRKSWSFSPISLSCGEFGFILFRLRKSFQIQYLKAIMDLTINFLMGNS